MSSAESLGPEHERVEAEAGRLFVPASDDREWYLFHSRPRCEKKAADACRDLSLSHYLPLRQSTGPKRKGQRQYSFEVPLFPGYLFGSCNLQERTQLMRRGFFVRWIEVVDQAKLLEELKCVYLASNQGVNLLLYPMLKRGQTVRVVRGPLVGLYGKVSRRKRTFRLVLNVACLDTAVACELDMDDVEVVDANAGE
jgi:transcription antitermination factor NusG